MMMAGMIFLTLGSPLQASSTNFHCSVSRFRGEEEEEDDDEDEDEDEDEEEEEEEEAEEEEEEDEAMVDAGDQR